MSRSGPRKRGHKWGVCLLGHGQAGATISPRLAPSAMAMERSCFCAPKSGRPRAARVASQTIGSTSAACARPRANGEVFWPSRCTVRRGVGIVAAVLGGGLFPQVSVLLPTLGARAPKHCRGNHWPQHRSNTARGCPGGVRPQHTIRLGVCRWDVLGLKSELHPRLNSFLEGLREACARESERSQPMLLVDRRRNDR